MEPAPDLHGRTTSFYWVLGALLLAIVAGVLLLITGGSSGPDDSGDAVYTSGEGIPKGGEARGAEIAATTADIVSAAVSREGDDLLLRVQVDAPLPERFDVSALSFRWTLITDEGPWVVVASLERHLAASVISTQRGFAAATDDGTFPGSVEAGEQEIVVRMKTADMPGDLDRFEWRLSSRLVAFAGVTDSPRIDDRFPDTGQIPFP